MNRHGKLCQILFKQIRNNFFVSWQSSFILLKKSLKKHENKRYAGRINAAIRIHQKDESSRSQYRVWPPLASVQPGAFFCLSRQDERKARGMFCHSWTGNCSYSCNFAGALGRRFLSFRRPKCSVQGRVNLCLHNMSAVDTLTTINLGQLESWFVGEQQISPANCNEAINVLPWSDGIRTLAAVSSL